MRFKLLFSIIFSLMVAIACTPSETDDSVTLAPTQAILEGSVDIMFPPSGAVIYAEVIYLSGTASDIPAEGFQIQLIAPDDSIIAEATVPHPETEEWSISIVHNYAGDPSEINIVAKSVDSSNTLSYDIESIILATMDNRPDGTFGEITSPDEGTSIGGDSLLVSGHGSGFFENTFSLILETLDGEIIEEIPVTLNNPNFVDDMPWQAEIPRGDFIGNARIRMAYQDMESGDTITLDSIDIVVSTVAG
ncbi:MAG: hypothetical protein Phog2KO_08780 [Phototrophicaceae bacterium]